MAYPIASLPNGQVRWSDGRVTGGMSSPTYNHVSTQSSGPTRNTMPYAPLGASTSSTGGGGGSPAPAPTQAPMSFAPSGNDDAIRRAEEERRAREEETRRQIEGGYGQYEDRLRGLEGTLSTDRAADEASALRTFDTISGGLQEQKAANLAKLQTGREAVGTRTASSIKDLQQNLSTTLRGASMQLGAMGAGDTSATRTMLPYAYTKMAGQQEASIRNQGNDQLFQIDQQERDTELEYSNLWRQTEVEKESKLTEVRNYYGGLLNNIRAEMARVPLSKAQDLASLSQSLLAEAQSNLRQLEAEDRQKKESLRQWGTERMAQLNNLKLELANNANFQPQDIMWNELQMMGATPQGGGGQDPLYNPMALANRRRQDYLG